MSISTTLHKLFQSKPVASVAVYLEGPRRLKVIILLAAVLGLDGADKGTVGAIGAQLESALNIGPTQVGLLVTASTLVGALATLPVGVLVDRVHRKRLLTGAIVIWSLAMVISGFSTSYLMLLLTRLALGAIVATAAPSVASLTGDLFPSFERGRIWGYLLAGELVGTAFGFMISGALAGLVSWRAAFIFLGIIGFVLAVVFGWKMEEPERGGHARLPPFSRNRASVAHDDSSADDKNDLVEDIEAYDIEPHTHKILETDPARWNLWRAARYILSIRTNVILIIASALGYFYFTGLRTFAVVYMSKQFSLAQSMASTVTVGLGLGAIVGVLVAGRVADRLIGRGYISARIGVAAAAFLATAGVFFSGLLIQTLAITLALFFLAAAALGATNPPLDSARLDIMHSRLWGRAESIRTTLRYLFEAAAPVTFGYVASRFDTHAPSGASLSESASQHSAHGLYLTLLIMLFTLVLGGLILLVAYRTYPRDVATALASERKTSQSA